MSPLSSWHMPNSTLQDLPKAFTKLAKTKWLYYEAIFLIYILISPIKARQKHTALIFILRLQPMTLILIVSSLLQSVTRWVWQPIKHYHSISRYQTPIYIYKFNPSRSFLRVHVFHTGLLFLCETRRWRGAHTTAMSELR